MNEKIISERIKIARENLDITKAEASRRLGLSKIGYCRYEYGERTPSMQTLEVIAQCFNTSVDYLVGDTDNPEPTQFVIDKDKAPELFELVRLCKDTDTKKLDRLLAYYKKIVQP